jgi:hypothetical protein
MREEQIIFKLGVFSNLENLDTVIEELNAWSPRRETDFAGYLGATSACTTTRVASPLATKVLQAPGGDSIFTTVFLYRERQH